MAKWADYLISAVSYNPNRQIINVEVHKDLDGATGPVEAMDRLTLIHNMRQGKTCVTIYKVLNSYKLGHKVNVFSVGGQPYIRIDKNRVNLDNLGDIPDLDYDDKKSLPAE